jgi:hypothetical protein
MSWRLTPLALRQCSGWSSVESFSSQELDRPPHMSELSIAWNVYRLVAVKGRCVVLLPLVEEKEMLDFPANDVPVPKHNIGVVIKLAVQCGAVL